MATKRQAQAPRFGGPCPKCGAYLDEVWWYRKDGPRGGGMAPHHLACSDEEECGWQGKQYPGDFRPCYTYRGATT